jgi:hypothetical protein
LHVSQKADSLPRYALLTCKKCRTQIPRPPNISFASTPSASAGTSIHGVWPEAPAPPSRDPHDIIAIEKSVFRQPWKTPVCKKSTPSPLVDVHGRPVVVADIRRVWFVPVKVYRTENVDLLWTLRLVGVIILVAPLASVRDTFVSRAMRV